MSVCVSRPTDLRSRDITCPFGVRREAWLELVWSDWVLDRLYRSSDVVNPRT